MKQIECDNCIHCEVCSFWKSVGGIERHFSNGGCGFFKDKNKIIELPCKVGEHSEIINQIKRNIENMENVLEEAENKLKGGKYEKGIL